MCNCQIWPSYLTIYSNDDLIIDDKASKSFGNTHVLLINENVSRIKINPKIRGESFELIAVRIYSPQTEVEIPLLKEDLVRLVFRGYYISIIILIFKDKYELKHAKLRRICRQQVFLPKISRFSEISKANRTGGH